MRDEIDDLFSRFLQTGDLDDLNALIRVIRRAVAAEPEDGPDHAWCLLALGGALEYLFVQSLNTDHLNEAVQALRSSVTATPEGDPERTLRLARLSGLLQAVASEQPDLLRDAVDTGRAAALATFDDDPYQTICLSTLGSALRVLAEHTGDMDMLREAVAVARATIAVAPSRRLPISVSSPRRLPSAGPPRTRCRRTTRTARRACLILAPACR
jgi:hypothetical protein